MKKILLLLLIGASLNVVAQTEGSEEAASTVEDLAPQLSDLEKEKAFINPAIEIPDVVALGQETVFDAGPSKIMSLSDYGNPNYSWDFGDGSEIRFGEVVKYTYTEPGVYRVKMNIKQGSERESIEKDIQVYTKQMVLITDVLQETLAAVDAEAAEEGVLLNVIEVPKDASDLSNEDSVIRKFQENLETLKAAESIIFYTSSTQGMQAFGQFWKIISQDSQTELKNKLLVQISASSLERDAKLIQPVYEIVQPQYIVLTRPESLNPIFTEESINMVFNELSLRGIEVQKVDEKSRIPVYLPFSRLLNLFSSSGLSQTVIYLLLSVPFLAFVIAFFRQFVGVSTFGVLAPLMLSLAFLVLGLQFGMAVFLVVMLVSWGIRVLFDRVELLYIPKVALLLSCLALSFFLVLGLAVYFEASLDLSLTIFPMMVMSSMSEKFLSSQSAEGIRSALIAVVETVLVSLIAYAFVDWAIIKDNVLAMPELILLPILGTIWLGKFTGLRVSEYIKFRSLLREESQE